MASYPLLELTGSAEELEIATAFVHEHGCLGTEEPDDASSLRVYFTESVNIHAIVDELGRNLPSLICRVATPVRSRDWLAEWKAELEGFSIGSRYFVLPTWKPNVETTRTVLRIDPGHAFGTGTHDTTLGRARRKVRFRWMQRDRRRHRHRNSLDGGRSRRCTLRSSYGRRPGSSRVRSRQPRAEWPVRGVRLECASWKELESIDADVVVANINTTILERAVRSMFGTILLSGILVEQVDDLDFPDDSEVMEQRNAVECAPLVIKRARHG